MTFRVFPRGMGRVVIFIVLSMVVLLSIVACNGDEPRSTNPTPSNLDGSIGKKSLDESTAVRLVQQYVSRSGGNVTVQIPYWETRKQTVTCYGDPQLEGCYEDPFSPTGYSKDRTIEERRCCRSELRSIPSRTSWQAVYQTTSDEWEVKAEFSLDDTKQLVEWIVEDDSRQVSESR
jgi:hypothetical protein